MKVYLSTTSYGFKDKEIHAVYMKIIGELEAAGHEVFYGEYVNSGEKAVVGNDPKELYFQNYKLLEKADFVIAEVSINSAIVGHEVSLAIDKKKPVLVLHNDAKERPSYFFRGWENPYLQLESYRNEQDLENILNDFTKSVGKKLDTKLFMILPAHLDQYLQWATDFHSKTKSDLIRQAIDDQAGADEDYQRYLGNLKRSVN